MVTLPNSPREVELMSGDGKVGQVEFEGLDTEGVTIGDPVVEPIRARLVVRDGGWRERGGVWCRRERATYSPVPEAEKRNVIKDGSGGGGGGMCVCGGGGCAGVVVVLCGSSVCGGSEVGIALMMHLHHFMWPHRGNHIPSVMCVAT